MANFTVLEQLLKRGDDLIQLKADLRKLVADLRIGGKSLSPDATHAYMFCADKIEKLLDGGE